MQTACYALVYTAKLSHNSCVIKFNSDGLLSPSSIQRCRHLLRMTKKQKEKKKERKMFDFFFGYITQFKKKIKIVNSCNRQNDFGRISNQALNRIPIKRSSTQWNHFGDLGCPNNCCIFKMMWQVGQGREP